MLWREATHEEAAQDFAQHWDMPPVLLYCVWLNLTDL